MDEKLKSGNMQKEQFSEWGRGLGGDTSDDWLVRRQGGIDPLTKILGTPLGSWLRTTLVVGRAAVENPAHFGPNPTVSLPIIDARQSETTAT